MKKQFVYILLMASLFGSCKKFLVETPRTAQNSTDFFKNENDFNLAVNGMYQAYRDIYGSKSSWVMGEMRSDNTHYDYKPSDAALAVTQRYDVANFLNDQFSGQTSDKWNRCYVVISRASNILDQINNIDFAQTNKDAIIGQARFFRAIAYFELVKYYGGVPIYVHLINNPEEIYIKRATVQAVYDQVMADATEAIQKLAAPAFPQSGRVTKGAALTLLADVYVNLKRFCRCRTFAETGYGHGV